MHLNSVIEVIMNPSSKHGYVMMLDVLGFRDFVSKDIGNDFFAIWESIQKSLYDKKEVIENRLRNQVIIDILCLSDTLIVCVSLSNKPINANIDDRELIVILPELINSFFQTQLNNKVFFRGAISYGEFSFSSEQTIVMGSALDEASDWYEAVDWIGIILTPSAEYAVEMFLSRKDIKPENKNAILTNFHEYPKIPFKDGVPPVCKYAFCWVDPCMGIDKSRDNWILILKIFSELKHSRSFAMKYKNALDFIHWLLFDEKGIHDFNSS